MNTHELIKNMTAIFKDGMSLKTENHLNWDGETFGMTITLLLYEEVIAEDTVYYT